MSKALRGVTIAGWLPCLGAVAHAGWSVWRYVGVAEGAAPVVAAMAAAMAAATMLLVAGIAVGLATSGISRALASS